MDDITQLLEQSCNGDEAARSELFQALYHELHRLARSQLNRGNNRGVLLDTTSLLHESYLRLVRVDHLRLASRGHFFAYASKVMRSIVIDLVRERLTERHGGGMEVITLDTDIGESIASSDEELVRMNEALEELATVDPRLVQVVEMRFFGGLTEKETAEALGTSERTVRRDWEKARLLLMAALK
jgi:RNA polymerase sigma factor (TIGR02999 family)